MIVRANWMRDKVNVSNSMCFPLVSDASVRKKLVLSPGRHSGGFGLTACAGMARPARRFYWLKWRGPLSGIDPGECPQAAHHPPGDFVASRSSRSGLPPTPPEQLCEISAEIAPRIY